MLASVEIVGELADVAMRGARYGFPGWVTETTQKNGRTKYSYLEKSEAGQRASNYLRGASKPGEIAGIGLPPGCSFVEDTAVAPEKLADYIGRFMSIVRRHETTAGVYAHASVGCLHVRPVVNMKTEEGVRKFEAIANEISDLVLEFGDTVAVAPVPHKAALDFLDGYFDRLRRSGAVRQSTSR